MSFNISHAFMTFFGVLLLALIVRSQDYSMEEDLKKLIARRKGLDIVREVISDFDNNLGRIAKRTCHYNAGMSHNCDYKQVASDLNDEDIWHEVGKKRRDFERSFKEAPSGIGTLLRSMKAFSTNPKKR
ncbi:uncharacterized protein LOC129225578 isoform X2 [Uloborus diversus]|uniref:uncharacterized protein LOC129225578 isoform X2 n=1 Tax=Uloborus diversus TaxID=327109 RepID=UPI00240915D5|nr:uncharacterized protein LOC129225578 isoform X2 [Uloborus diversus]